MSKYAEGYQDALSDIANVLLTGGEDSVRHYLADNLGREDLRTQDAENRMHDRSGDPDYSERDSERTS